MHRTDPNKSFLLKIMELKSTTAKFYNFRQKRHLKQGSMKKNKRKQIKRDYFEILKNKYKIMVKLSCRHELCHICCSI